MTVEVKVGGKLSTNLRNQIPQRNVATHLG